MRKIFSVIEYGAKPDGETLSSNAVQKAIDVCANSGGGTVLFPKGTYVLSTVFLKSGTHIKFEDGTVILGSLNFYDYNPDEKVDYPLYQDASHSFFHCSMFVAENCNDISISGNAVIDMRSVWDEENVRNMVHRGAKCVALKNCFKVNISDFTINNATDLAVYFAGCKDVIITRVKMKVYIDGISPDNCENVKITDCDIETGDDGIVFKSSYTLNRLGICKNIVVKNCRVKSRCNAIKFGTETNGGFEDIIIDGVKVRETRITGLSIESVDGAKIKNITVKNIRMTNVNAPIFIHVGKRMRGPEELSIGSIENVTIENMLAEGPYVPYAAIPWNYFTWKAEANIQYPWNFLSKPNFDYSKKENCELSDWQFTSNVCGLEESPLKNIKLKNIKLILDGGVKNNNLKAREEPLENYPEVDVYGKFLPAKGIFFRHVNGLVLDNVSVETYREDVRENFVFEKTTNVFIH